MQGIIYQGEVRDPGFEISVNDARESLGPKYWWDPEDDPRNCRIRTEPIEGAVIHHQAGEGDADNVFNVLNKRPRRKRKGFTFLSVHFEIDQNGLITQLADVEDVCKHAGNANGWSWGVEIANVGYGKCHPSWPREEYEDHMHGRRKLYRAFYQAQKEATVALVKAVHTVLGLGFRIPCDEDGKPIRWELEDDQMDEYDIFAHYMLTDNKPDPAPDMMDYLVENLPVAAD